MIKNLKDLNRKYNDDTYPIFPYLSEGRIIPVRKGFYRKHSAKFRGVTAIYNETTEAYEYPLYGMYYISEDIIIMPDGMDISKGKKRLLKAHIAQGYKIVQIAPVFVPYMFPEGSWEAKLALANKLEYQNETSFNKKYKNSSL